MYFIEYISIIYETRGKILVKIQSKCVFEKNEFKVLKDVSDVKGEWGVEYGVWVGCVCV